MFRTGRIQTTFIAHNNLRKPLTICNIYRPPHDNNSNDNISKFLSELSPVLDILQRENTYAAVVGDFNINLLQINEREKFEDFFDLMCTNSFYPKITLPTRFSKHSCSLIDQFFCKVPHKNISSSIVLSSISDHFPCIVKVNILRESNKPPKYIYVRKGTLTLCPCQNPFQYPLQFPCPSHRLHWIRIPVSFRLNFMSTTASPDVKVWFCIGTCKIRMETDVRISFSRSGDRSKRNGR